LGVGGTNQRQGISTGLKKSKKKTGGKGKGDLGGGQWITRHSISRWREMGVSREGEKRKEKDLWGGGKKGNMKGGLPYDTGPTVT